MFLSIFGRYVTTSFQISPVRAIYSEELAEAGEDVSAPAAVHPLVVVPGEDLDEGATLWVLHDHGGEGVDDGGPVVVDDVGGNDWVGGVAEDALESWGLGGSLEGGVDLFLSAFLLDVDGDIDEGAGDGWDTEGKAVHGLWWEGLDDAWKSDSGTSGGWDDVHGSSPSPPEVLVHNVRNDLIVSVGVDGGHETVDDLEVLVEGLGDWGKAVGGAGSVGDALGFWLEVGVVNTKNEGAFDLIL